MFVPRILFMFESPEDGGGAPAAVADPPVDPGAVPPADAAPGADAGVLPPEPSGEAAAPGWADGFETDPRFRTAVQDEAAAIAQEQVRIALEQLGVFDPPQQQQQQYDLDPMSDGFGQSLQQLIRDELAQATAPLRAQEEQAHLAEGAQRQDDIIADFTARSGDFLVPDLAVQATKDLSNVLYAQEAARIGEGPRAAEAALFKAAQMVKGLEDAAAKAGVEKHMNQLGVLAGAPDGPLAGGSGGTEVKPQYASELEAARAFAARQRQV